MDKIAQYLNQNIVGNVFDKLTIRYAFDGDRSIIKNIPDLIAVPETTDDVRKLLRFANQLANRGTRLPVVVRGNGHDKTGAATTNGMLISTRKLNKIQEIDVRSRLVRVQAGATLGQINSALSLFGLTLPIAAHEHETIGGLISNCYSDDYAVKYGGILNFVDRAEVTLVNGDLLRTEIVSHHALDRKKTGINLENEIYRTIDRLTNDYEAILKRDNKVIDSVGYSTVSLVKNNKTFDLLPLLFSAQGTLGVITEVILHPAVLRPHTHFLMANFKTIRPSIDFMNFTKNLKPLMVNIYDNRILKTAVENGKKPQIFPHRFGAGYTVLVGFDDKPRTAKKKIRECLDFLPESIRVVAEDNDNTNDFAEFHNAVTNFLNSSKGERAPIVDDTFVSSEHLAKFITELEQLENDFDVELPFFGSFTSNNYSVRPDIKFDQISGRQFALKFIQAYAKLVEEHEGSITGGGPEGCVKALALKLPEKELELFKEIKQVFDPNNILGSDIKTGAHNVTTIRRLRANYNHGIITK
ncbi:FAD-binding oxidoreductase [Candidatus Saccharibacteria bacterium]|nr:FAD-binding oxidoreductase [Candidatus Saccharibacteria bacterium]